MKLLTRKQLYEIILILHIEGYYGQVMSNQQAKKHLRRVLKEYPSMIDGWIRAIATTTTKNGESYIRRQNRFLELYKERCK